MKILQHKFVEFIPEDIEEGILYVSMEYCTATHKCVCGCGNEVVTPLSPTDWCLCFDGETISLSPSIGNWGFSCQTHYWIVKNQIRYAGKWTTKQVEANRKADSKRKANYYKKRKKPIKSKEENTPFVN